MARSISTLSGGPAKRSSRGSCSGIQRSRRQRRFRPGDEQPFPNPVTEVLPTIRPEFLLSLQPMAFKHSESDERPPESSLGSYRIIGTLRQDHPRPPGVRVIIRATGWASVTLCSDRARRGGRMW
jgi:hypothetical protein